MRRSVRESVLAVLAALLLGLLVPAAPAAAQTPFIAFESGLVRPLALSPDGSRLFAANTPDNRIEIFNVTAGGLSLAASVPVGMEPVALAAVSPTEVWVVNHLSDSVSIVELGTRWEVTRTLLVGDEPRDIVITDPDAQGPLSPRAFVTTAHRGQQRTDPTLSSVPGAGDPQLTTPGVGRADVWVFDTAAPGETFGGTPLAIVELFGDTPRALAVSPGGETVYAAVFHSGNQTAVVPEGLVCDGFGTSPCSGDGVTSPGGLSNGRLPGGNPGPAADHNGAPAPEVGLVVQFDPAEGIWKDEQGRNWSNGIRFHLPDLDVFEIDAASLGSQVSHAHVGTILFNMAVNPVNGNVYVSNTDAQNLTRFEGPGTTGGSTVQGNLAQSRVTVITKPDGQVKPRHLNRHIDYSVLPAPPGTKQHSLATPLDMVVSSDGTTLYVAAFGSSTVGVFDTADLENDALWDTPFPGGFDPTQASARYLDVSGGGPAGLALDEAHDRLYVLTRFDQSVAILDLASGTEVGKTPLHNPEPPSVVAGRPILYDAFRTSSNGEASCSSCHIFGDMDSLAWDLGDPDASVKKNPLPINFGSLLGFLGGNVEGLNGTGNVDDLHPMKGPMTTQTLRGLRNSGAMHWRADRSVGFFGTDAFDEDLSFRNFIVAFPGLVGDSRQPTDPQLQEDMQRFADFALQITLPPNPVRALDNSLTPAQQRGRDFYMGDTGQLADGSSQIPGFTGFTCNGCHLLDPAQGFFGTQGLASFENEPQIVKIPHLRNLYQKVGMFGMGDVPFNNPTDPSHQGDQVRGTGFLHDGSTDTLFRFFQATVFNNPSIFDGSTDVGFDGGDPQRRDVEQFMLAFDSDLAPIVGQQVTLDAGSGTRAHQRVDLMLQRAQTAFASQILGGATTECDLVVKGVEGGELRGWLFDPQSGLFETDRAGETLRTDAALRELASLAGSELTYTCAPPGSGLRMALDRDQDGVLDGDERDAHTDVADAASFTGACADGIDNDGDGLVDVADPGCRDAGWSHESPACSNGFDDDGDGLVDAGDAVCVDRPYRTSERRATLCGLLGLEPLALVLLVRRLRRRRRA